MNSGNSGPRESDPQGHVFRSIDGEPILPDAHANECALCGKSEAYHSNAHQHGPTCAETPVDHRCGDTEIDQGTTWDDSAAYHSAQMKAILDLHQNTQASGGAVTGYCCECNWQWPCPTYHIAAGWGIESYHDCEDEGWCKHAEVKMFRREVTA